LPKPEDRLSSGTMCHLWEYVHCEQPDYPDPEKTPPCWWCMHCSHCQHGADWVGQLAVI